MGIVKAPGLLTFLIALVVAIAGVVSHLGVAIPYVSGYEFWMVFVGFLLLVFGCLFRGM